MSDLLEKIASLSQSLKDWWLGSKTVHILLTGKTGVGKSSLVNSLVGDEVASEGHDLDPETMIVSPFKTKINGVEITVWDSPGLQDGKGNEKKYIEDMKRQEYDLVLYCCSMTDTRFGDDDAAAMVKLTNAFGKTFWENAVFVLTFANRVKPTKRNPDAYKNKLSQFQAKMREELEKMSVNAGTAKEICVVPAGYADGEPDCRKLPDCKDWLSRLWYVSVFKMKEGAQPAMLKSSLSRLKKVEDVTEEDLKKPGHQQPIDADTGIVTTAAKYGAAPAILGILGAAVGSAIGSVVPVAGTAAGAAAGAAAGGAVGGVVDGMIAYFST